VAAAEGGGDGEGGEAGAAEVAGAEVAKASSQAKAQAGRARPQAARERPARKRVGVSRFCPGPTASPAPPPKRRRAAQAAQAAQAASPEAELSPAPAPPRAAARKSFAVGCLVRVLREQQRGQVAEVAEVAHGWVKLRLGGQLLSFRPRELEASSGGTETGAGGRCGEAAAPAGWNGSEAWSGGELQQLREAHFEISPEAVDFWEQVARRVGRSVQECTAEFYRQHPTPGRQRRRRSSPAPGVPPPPSGLHPDLLQASPWRSGASAADEGEESDGGEGGVLRSISAMSRSQIGDYAQKVKAKQLKGRATAAFRAGRAPAKRRRSAAAAAEGAAPVACAPQRTDGDDEDDEDDEDEDVYFDE